MKVFRLLNYGVLATTCRLKLGLHLLEHFLHLPNLFVFFVQQFLGLRGLLDLQRVPLGTDAFNLPCRSSPTLLEVLKV